MLQISDRLRVRGGDPTERNFNIAMDVTVGGETRTAVFSITPTNNNSGGSSVNTGRLRDTAAAGDFTTPDLNLPADNTVHDFDIVAPVQTLTFTDGAVVQVSIPINYSYTTDINQTRDIVASYTLLTAPTITDDYAGNTSTLGSLSVGGSTTGNIETSGDTDWFAITLTAGQTYTFDEEGSETGQGTLADPLLRLRDSSGTFITSDDDSGTGLNSRITYTAAASGTYYLDAEAFSGTGTYRLSASVSSSVSINDVSITEGNSGTKTLTFTVTRTGGTAAFAVDYATADGTATAGQDYVGTSGTLLFGANETAKTISVTINGDTTVEPNETFFVHLSNATNGATISDSEGIGTILNDDIQYRVSDPLMTNTSGALEFVHVENGSLTFQQIGGLGPEWKFEGAGNFLGSSSPGFLIYNTGGVIGGALQVGSVVNGSAQFTSVGGIGPEWKFEGNGDFLGTGKSEFLIHNTGGVINGALQVGSIVNNSLQFTSIGGVGPEWQFKGTGDFLDDGHTGFLIYNTGSVASGALEVGEVLGGQAVYTSIGGVGPEWQFEGVGDFLGDGHTDFLIRNTGSVAPGKLEVAEVTNGHLTFTDIGGVGPEWEFIGSGKYKGGAEDDFLMHNTGNVNGGTLQVGSVVFGVAQFTTVGGVGPEWTFHDSL
jgi:hypothetical protein